MDSDDLKKQILDESLIHDGKLCIDLKNDSVVSSDYQIIPEENLKDLKKIDLMNILKVKEIYNNH